MWTILTRNDGYACRRILKPGKVRVKTHTIVSMLGTDFTYEVLPVGAAQIPAFVRGGGSKKEKGVCLQDAYY